MEGRCLPPWVLKGWFLDSFSPTDLICREAVKRLGIKECKLNEFFWYFIEAGWCQLLCAVSLFVSKPTEFFCLILSPQSQGYLPSQKLEKCLPFWLLLLFCFATEYGSNSKSYFSLGTSSVNSPIHACKWSLVCCQMNRTRVQLDSLPLHLPARWFPCIYGPLGWWK